MKLVWVDGLCGFEPQLWADDWVPLAGNITVRQTTQILETEHGLSLSELAVAYPYRTRGVAT